MGFLKKYYTEAPAPDSMNTLAKSMVTAVPPPKPAVKPPSLLEAKPVEAKPLPPDERIQAIEAQALQLGWTKKQLWQVCKRPDKKGLVTCIRQDQQIAEVTERYIELHRTAVTGKVEVQRFYNMNTAQPWLKLHLDT